MSTPKKSPKSSDRHVVSYEAHHRVLKQLQALQGQLRKCQQQRIPVPGATLAEYPNIPEAVLPALNNLFSDTPNQVGRYLRRLWQRSMFPNDVALETEELDELSGLWRFMEALLDAPREVQDELEALNVGVN